MNARPWWAWFACRCLWAGGTNESDRRVYACPMCRDRDGDGDE